MPSDHSLSSHALSAYFNYFKTHRPQVIFEVGAFNTTQGSAKDIDISGLIGDHFSVNNNHASNTLIGMGLYWEGPQLKQYDLLYGMNAFYLFHTTVNGSITQENLYTNLGYSYSLSNLPIYLDIKARNSAIFNGKLPVTADIGVGVNFISTSNVNEYSLDGGATVPDTAFSGKTNVKPSFTVGLSAALNNLFHSTTPFGCGYRFFFLSNSNFDKRSNQLLNTLNTGANYANAITCTVSV